MAPAGDRDLGTVLGNGSCQFEMRCRLCGTDLGQDWPDLSKLNPLDIKNHPLDAWRAAADWGCPFCNIIIAVLNDSWKQYGCHDTVYYKNPEIAPDPEMQGFQVLLHHNGKGQYLLALEHVNVPLRVRPATYGRGNITIYLDGPDIHTLNLEPFFEIPSRSSSIEVLNLARDWLSTCRNCHSGCSAGLNIHDDSSRIPNGRIRMIEIKNGDPKLVQFKFCEVMPAYIALSHCWGSPATTLKTLSTNMDNFQRAIPFGSLPTTFKHAIEVAKSLGFEYIWIDSLCIVQDSLLDWEEQSSLMALIYSKADLVLAASSASSTEDGFLKERTAYRESLLELNGTRDRTQTVRLKYRLLLRKGMRPMLDPLDRRAWALQERMVARRYLAFGSHEISWACIDYSACECEWWRIATTWREEIQNVEANLRRATNNEIGDYWRVKVLEQYCRRRLSDQSDKLFAISAIASIFDSRIGSGYLAGIWKADLPVGLLWTRLSPASAYVEDRPTIPSWSWASLPLHDISMTVRTSQHGDSLVKVLEASTQPSTVNRFGSVTGGFLKLWVELWKTDIRAKNLQHGLRSLELLQSDLGIRGLLKDKISFHLDTSLIKSRVILPKGSTLTSVRRIRLDEVQERHYVAGVRKDEVLHLFMVPLFQQYKFGYGRKMVHGLLLARSLKSPMCFERIGNFFCSEPCSNDLGATHAQTGGQEITII